MGRFKLKIIKNFYNKIVKNLQGVVLETTSEKTQKENTDLINPKKYEGTDVLEMFEDAYNYNGHILNCALKYLKPGKNTLDFGAGKGTFSRMLKGRGLSMSCVEKDPAMYESLKKEFSHVYNDIDQVPDNSLDQVFSCNVLEHIENDQMVLKSLNRALNTNGLIYVYVPAHMFLYTKFDKRIGHVRRYSEKEIKLKFENAGFNIISCRQVDSLGVLATLL